MILQTFMSCRKVSRQNQIISLSDFPDGRAQEDTNNKMELSDAGNDPTGNYRTGVLSEFRLEDIRHVTSQ